MKRVQTMKLSTKILWGFILAAIITVGIGIVGIMNISPMTQLIALVAGVIITLIIGIYLSRTLKRALANINKTTEAVADGDFSIEVDAQLVHTLPRLAKAFQKMIGNLNMMMSSIDASSEQVAAGSKQISESGGLLSQGATEQASAIEQLTASIDEVSSQTKLNSDNANNANSLAIETKANAEHGNVQMKEMLTAMDDINESSGNISKIIKVIDEIAFQTNILALNAAVEAARAGQHGRGFAVVAEEVRNLAARSANAAKETTAMIEGSINKVEGGMKIANQTAEALDSIIGDIAKVSDLIGGIAVASGEQSTAIEQINQAVMQVSAVVQTNSSTAEESAAASGELAGQAELLKQEVAKVKLKKDIKSMTDMDFSGGGHKITIKDQPQRKKEITLDSFSAEELDEPEPEEKIKNIDLTDSEFGKY